MSEPHAYHRPVLLEELMPLLVHKSSGVFLDGTLGGGGHFWAMAERLDKNGTVIGIDRDPEAIAWNRARERTGVARIIIEQSPFSAFDSVLSRHGIKGVDGMLLDLGVSSHQIDAPDRGFSYQQDAELDMRMDRSVGVPAYALLAQTTEEQLADILREYGEVSGASRLARSLLEWNAARPIRRSSDLRAWCAKTFKGQISIDLLARIFQSLRIAVNDELGELKRFFDKAIEYLNPKGRIAVIAYHSLEDRLVKEFMRANERSCVCPPEVPQCRCAARPRLRRLTKKALRPSASEIERNRRARSARLRVAEKIAEAS